MIANAPFGGFTLHRHTSGLSQGATFRIRTRTADRELQHVELGDVFALLNANLMARPFIAPIFCFITKLGSFAARSPRSLSPAERFDSVRIFAMKRMMMILATAALASTLVSATAEARGGGFGGGGHVGGFGGGAHIGGVMGAGHIGGIGGGVHVGGMMSAGHIGGIGGGAHVGGMMSAGHIGGIGGGAHVGGMIGSAHIGGIGEGMHAGGVAVPDRIGHLGGEHLGLGDHTRGYDGGLHQHAMHRFRRYSPGYLYDDGLDCYDWYRLHPGEPLPLSCG